MSIKENIQNLIDKNDIIFMKGTPDSHNVDFQWQFQTF